MYIFLNIRMNVNLWFLKNGYIGNETCQNEGVSSAIRHILPDIMYCVG
jgi:hypothetical protein